MNGPTVQHQLNGVAEGGTSTRIDVVDTAGGRILCIADLRGKLSMLNEYAAQFSAKAIIHAGDFGFFDRSSLSRISERTLRHLVQYSNLLTPAARQTILAASSLDAMRTAVLNAAPNGFALSDFPKLVSGEIKLAVPVYTVYGACEDVAILERLRAEPPGAHQVNATPLHGHPTQSNWSIPNLTVLSEGVTRLLLIGGVRLRLFGLGGALVPHKFFDNGEGQATIAGAGGTMWTTILQIGELVDTAQRVFDPTETRMLITHASPGREGLLAQLALALKADLTISAGLHFRYGVSYNEYSVQHDAEAYRNKLLASKLAFNEVWDTVKTQVEQVIDEQQRKFLDNALAVANRLPAETSASQGGANLEEPAWKNSWNWNLPDANYGSLVLDVREGRFSAEMRSQGFNFAYRAQQGPVQRGPAVKVPSSHQHQQPLPPASQTVPTSAGKPIPSAAPGTDRPGPANAFKSKDGEDRPPHHHHQEHSERGGLPRGRGGRGGALRGGNARILGAQRDAPVPALESGEASSSPVAGAVKPVDSSAAVDSNSAIASTPPTGGTGAPSRFGGPEGRGRGRGGRGRGEGRGDFRGTRGGFRGGRGGHSGGGTSQSGISAGLAEGTDTPVASNPNTSNGPVAAKKPDGSGETGWE